MASSNIVFDAEYPHKAAIYAIDAIEKENFALSRELAGVVPGSSQNYNIYYKWQPIIEGAVNRFMETISRIFKAKGFF